MNTVYGKYKLLSDFEFDELFFLEKPKDEFIVFFELLIKELTNYCKNNGLDSSIKFVGNGMTSAVYSIGDKIIKIGIPRKNESIPYCEYLLQPIINRDFEFDGYPIHIEVTQKVLVYQDIKKYCSCSDFSAIIDDFYEKLYSIGLASSDLHIGNIGILTSDNTIHFDLGNFDIGNDIATSIMNNNNLRVRHAGEFVIIDLDCLKIVNMTKYSKYLRSIGFNFENRNVKRL